MYSRYLVIPSNILLHCNHLIKLFNSSLIQFHYWLLHQRLVFIDDDLTKQVKQIHSLGRIINYDYKHEEVIYISATCDVIRSAANVTLKKRYLLKLWQATTAAVYLDESKVTTRRWRPQSRRGNEINFWHQWKYAQMRTHTRLYHSCPSISIPSSLLEISSVNGQWHLRRLI